MGGKEVGVVLVPVKAARDRKVAKLLTVFLG